MSFYHPSLLFFFYRPYGDVKTTVGLQFTEINARGQMNVKICEVFIIALRSQSLAQSNPMCFILIAFSLFH
jgi:hypothetical protein